MAVNKRITELNPLSVATADDLLAIVELGASPNETMKITKGNLMGSPGPIGSNNASTGDFSALTLVNQIDEFSTDGTMSGDSDTAVPTEKAVKSYVDTEIQNATDNVVRLDIVPTSTDTTATIGDAVLADTTSGAVEIDLVPGGDGRILVIQTGINSVTIVTSEGTLYDGGPVPSVLINLLGGSREFLCDGSDFYVI